MPPRPPHDAIKSGPLHRVAVPSIKVPPRADPMTAASLDHCEAAGLAARPVRADAAASGPPRGIPDMPTGIAAPSAGGDGTAIGSPREGADGFAKAGASEHRFRTGRLATGASIPRLQFAGAEEIKPRHAGAARRSPSCPDGAGRQPERTARPCRTGSRWPRRQGQRRAPAPGRARGGSA